MNFGKKLLISTLTGLAFVGYSASASDQTDQLRDLAKQARDKGDLILAANYLCEAASLDASHYDKKCERARSDAEKKTKEYEADLQVGKFELQHKDYPGAIRDLSKIDFGPHRDEAQQLIQQAKSSLPGSNPESADRALLQSAQAAYQGGDFNAAAVQASQVRSESLLPAARQLLTNIKVYQDTMAQAGLLEQKADYKGAREKYSFAMTIDANGPGSPADKLHDVEAKLASQSETAKTQPSPDAAKPMSAPPKIDYAAKVKSGLADARRREAVGDFKTALRVYDSVLVLEGRQAEALAGKQRVESELRNDPKALASSLEDGIRSYYNSQFEQAVESISLYLDSGGLHSQGAAHFYMAAALLSEAILADPHDEHRHSLLQNADDQFSQARRQNYKPVAKLVSPRILAEWTKSESQP